jgi:hypothetical protein
VCCERLPAASTVVVLLACSNQPEGRLASSLAKAGGNLAMSTNLINYLYLPVRRERERQQASSKRPDIKWRSGQQLKDRRGDDQHGSEPGEHRPSSRPLRNAGVAAGRRI